MAKEKQQPRYMENAEGEVRLYSADDIEAGRANGLKEPTRMRSNGEPWNPTVEEGEVSQVQAISDAQEVAAKVEAGRAERKAKADEKARVEAERARADAPADDRPRVPDFRVEVVNTGSDAATTTTAAKKPAK